MTTKVGDEVTELLKLMGEMAVDERVYATKQGAVVVLTQEGVARETLERYRRVHKTRKLGL